MTAKTEIYFADLSHTGTIVSANFFPLGIGSVAAYMASHLSDSVKIDLFKYPQDLDEALSRRVPRIVAFSNYSWNLNLSYEFIKQIKQKFPETVVVLGGPNYGFSDEEVASFWSRYPLVDFHIIYEGEQAMLKLFKVLSSYQFDHRALKMEGAKVSSCHYEFEGNIIKGEPLPRIKNFHELPSPYLAGIMDKFFDGVLVPMISTTRGCPFSCTYCSEGNTHYNKVVKRVDLKEELEYIAQRVGAMKDIALTDANWGMFREDIEKAEIFSQIQKQFDYPKNMLVSGGKNQKERVLQVASMLDGAMYAGGAMQTTDESILKTIKRSNISLEELGTASDIESPNDVDSYTELILALPGDNVASHAKSLRDMVAIGVNRVRMYQLIMLPQTEMNTKAMRESFGMKTKYRIMPRSFGKYQILNNEITAIEYEEICVGNNSLSFEDYLDCRELNLTIEVVNNGRFFQELSGLCKMNGLSWFDVVIRFHTRRRESMPGLKHLYDRFREDSIEGLWETPGDLINEVSETIDVYLSDEMGTNELAKAKAIGISQLQEELHHLLFEEMESELKSKGLLDHRMASYLRDLKIYSSYRKNSLLDTSAVYEADLSFDFQAISENGFLVDPMSYMFDKPVSYVFKHDSDQVNLIDSYMKQYGDSVDGLGRILMRAHYKNLIRDVRQKNISHSCRDNFVNT